MALLSAEIVSSTGSVFTFVALPWFVLQTGSPTDMSIVLAAEVLPMALFGIPSGSVVSRLGARTTMLISDAVRAPLVALVPILHWTGHLSFGLLVAIVFCLGLFTAPYIGSQRSIVPEIFGDDETVVAKASGLFSGANQLPILIGPAIGGLLIGFVGTAPLLLLDGATFLFAFVTVLLFVRGGKRIPSDESSQGVLAGVRYLARDKLLGPTALSLIVLDGAANAIAVAVPLLAYTRYEQNPRVFGWTFAAFGIGAVASSLLVVKLLDRFKPLRLACVGIIGVCIPLWLVAAPISWPARRARAVPLRCVRAARERAVHGNPLDAAAGGGAREGAHRGDDGERPRSAARAPARRPRLQRLGQLRRVALDRGRDDRRRAALRHGGAARVSR